MKDIRIDDRAYGLIKAYQARINAQDPAAKCSMQQAAAKLIEEGASNAFGDALATPFAGELRCAMEAVAAADRADRAQEEEVLLSAMEKQALAMRATCVCMMLIAGKDARSIERLLEEAYAIVLSKDLP